MEQGLLGFWKDLIENEKVLRIVFTIQQPITKTKTGQGLFQLFL